MLLKCLFCPFWVGPLLSFYSSHIFTSHKSSSLPPIPSHVAHLRTSPSTTPWPWPSFVLRSCRTPCRAWPRCAPWLSMERQWMWPQWMTWGYPKNSCVSWFMGEFFPCSTINFLEGILFSDGFGVWTIRNWELDQRNMVLQPSRVGILVIPPLKEKGLITDKSEYLSNNLSSSFLLENIRGSGSFPIVQIHTLGS